MVKKKSYVASTNLLIICYIICFVAEQFHMEYETNKQMQIGYYWVDIFRETVNYTLIGKVYTLSIHLY